MYYVKKEVVEDIKRSYNSRIYNEVVDFVSQFEKEPSNTLILLDEDKFSDVGIRYITDSQKGEKIGIEYFDGKNRFPIISFNLGFYRERIKKMEFKLTTESLEKIKFLVAKFENDDIIVNNAIKSFEGEKIAQFKYRTIWHVIATTFVLLTITLPIGVVLGFNISIIFFVIFWIILGSAIHIYIDKI